MEMSTTVIFELKSNWSRLVHRIHTLGVTRHVYLNQVANFTEKRIYPRQFPSYREDSSQSLDGTHLWKMNNWDQGWIVINRAKQKAAFLFSSKAGNVFHRIEVDAESHWDCLECLLKVFILKELPSAKDVPLFKKLTNTHSPTSDFRAISQLICQAVENKQRMKYTMPTGGGLITRTQCSSHFSKQHESISIESDNGKLIIDPSQVKHVNLTRNNRGFMGTLYNTQGTPQFILESY